MAMVTVYNTTDKKITGLHHGAPYELPPTGGGEVGQILVSEKCAQAILVQHGTSVTLNRSDIAGTVNNIADKLREENVGLRKENDGLKQENAFLKNQLEKIQQEYMGDKKTGKPAK